MSIFSRIKDFFSGGRGDTAPETEDINISDGYDDAPDTSVEWTIEDVYESQFLFNERDGQGEINNFLEELATNSERAQSLPGHENRNKATYSGVGAELANLVLELTSQYGAGVVAGALEKAKQVDGMDLNHFWLFYLTDNDEVNDEQDAITFAYSRMIETEARALAELQKKQEEVEKERRRLDAENRARAQEQARRAAETARKYSESAGEGTQQRGIFGRRKK